jgi:Ca-activated chloride channel family protein
VAADAWRAPSPEPQNSHDDADRSRRAVAHEQEQRGYPAADRPQDGGFGQPVYLSNDDTMSLSSAQRVVWAIERFAPIPREHVRPHELLNYFSFQTQPVAGDHDFSVLANVAELDSSRARLALSIQGRPVTRSSRRNVNLSYVIDRSGSMAAEGRMEYLKQGLLRSLDELKHGDVVHVTLFDTDVCQLAENFVVGRDDLSRLRSSISRITPEGSTNLHDGLRRGYEAADRAYQPGYSNRVLMVTDAEANTGVTDQGLIATVGQNYDARRIRLSGIGVGSTFNDSLLDQLTERGRGAYVFLGSPSEVDAVFGSRFVSLIETVAGDVHFRLHLPPSLAMETFYGEEASVSKERVQAVHYFAGTSQLFLSDLQLRDGKLAPNDDVMISIEYEDPESGAARVEEFAWRLGDIAGRAPNLDKASYVDAFARTVQTLADRPVPTYSEQRYGWLDSSAGVECRDRKGASAFFAAPIQADGEVRRIEQLWDTFCSRYPVAMQPPTPPRPPHHHRPGYQKPRYQGPSEQPHNDFAPPDAWPGATSSR